MQSVHRKDNLNRQVDTSNDRSPLATKHRMEWDISKIYVQLQTNAMPSFLLICKIFFPISTHLSLLGVSVSLTSRRRQLFTLGEAAAAAAVLQFLVLLALRGVLLAAEGWSLLLAVQGGGRGSINGQEVRLPSRLRIGQLLISLKSGRYFLKRPEQVEPLGIKN